MRDLWNIWVQFWSTTEDAFPIAMVRISIGFTLLYTCASPYFSNAWTAIWVDQQYGGIRPYRRVPWLLDLLGGATPTGVEMLLWLGMGCATLLIFGLAGRFAALMGMFVMNTIAWHNPLATGGHDDLIANALWLLVFVPNDQTHSVWCKITTGKWVSNTPILSAVRKLLLAQLVIVYASTGLQKVSAHWVPFGNLDALWYILQQPTWSWRDHSFLAPYFTLTQIATLGTWLFEVSAPLLLLFCYWESSPKPSWFAPKRVQRWIQRLRPRVLFAAIGIPMHIGILLTMDVGPFSYAALSYYWALFRKDAPMAEKSIPEAKIQETVQQENDT